MSLLFHTWPFDTEKGLRSALDIMKNSRTRPFGFTLFPWVRSRLPFLWSELYKAVEITKFF